MVASLFSRYATGMTLGRSIKYLPLVGAGAGFLFGGDTLGERALGAGIGAGLGLAGRSPARGGVRGLMQGIRGEMGKVGISPLAERYLAKRSSAGYATKMERLGGRWKEDVLMSQYEGAMGARTGREGFFDTMFGVMKDARSQIASPNKITRGANFYSTITGEHAFARPPHRGMAGGMTLSSQMATYSTGSQRVSGFGRIGGASLSIY